MDKYTEHLLKYEHLLEIAKAQSSEKYEELHHNQSMIGNYNWNLAISEDRVERINGKIKIINNYDKNIKKNRKIYLKKWLETVKKFNIAYLVSVILAALMGAFSVNIVWVLIVAEILLFSATGICYFGNYQNEIGYIRSIYKNNTIDTLSEKLLKEQDLQQDIKNKKAEYIDEKHRLDAEIKELNEIITKLKACIDNIKNVRSAAYENIFSIENISKIINEMYDTSVEQGLIEEVPEEALSLTRKKENKNGKII